MIQKYNYKIDDLIEIVKYLRSENGCSWDKEQTKQSLIPCLLEEAYEVVDGILKNDIELQKEELGDLLFNVLFQITLSEEKNEFNFSHVVNEISKKLIRRHPHIFKKDTEKEQLKANQVLEQWDEIKAKEKRESFSILDSVSEHFPAFLQAEKLQKIAKKKGFDWENKTDVLNKVFEELNEVKLELDQKEINQEKLEEEIGDLLFSMVNLTRHLKISPELALLNSIDKFKKRFTYIETKIKNNKKEFSDYSQNDLDSFWEEAKRKN